MIINSKTCSMKIAIVAFFGVACIGALCQLSPWTCSKRALICAVIIYALCRGAVKVVNRIILNALVKSQLNKQEESVSGSHE